MESSFIVKTKSAIEEESSPPEKFIAEENLIPPEKIYRRSRSISIR
jgi:hypothetical protein